MVQEDQEGLRRSSRGLTGHQDACSGACRRVCHSARRHASAGGAAVAGAGGRERDAGRVAHQNIGPHLPIHGLRDCFGTLVNEECVVKQAQDWLGHSDPATTVRHYVRLTTAARAKAVAGLDEVTRAALEAAEDKILEDAQPLEDNVVALASRRR